jgi:hypothetical protein
MSHVYQRDITSRLSESHAPVQLLIGPSQDAKGVFPVASRDFFKFSQGMAESIVRRISGGTIPNGKTSLLVE